MRKNFNKKIAATFLAILAIASIAIAQYTIERGRTTDLPEQIASGSVAPGECLIVVKEHPERFVSTAPGKIGWIRITEIIKDIEICNNNGQIVRSYHEHVITCDKSPDLRQVSCIDYHANEASPFCGNGIVEHGEQCDDGNIQNGDGCNQYCQLE
jgi:cysteine-rich repeat protein